MSVVDTCKKNEENLKENFLSVSQYYHIRVTFLGVVCLLLFRRKMTNLGIVYLFLFQKKMTNLVFSTVISLAIVFLEKSSFSQTGVGRLNEPHLSLLGR